MLSNGMTRRPAGEGHARVPVPLQEYTDNMVPFTPTSMEPRELQLRCLDARRSFYSWQSIFRRGLDRVNRADAFMFRNFFPINAMLRADTNQRDGYPLGDPSWHGTLLPVWPS